MVKGKVSKNQRISGATSKAPVQHFAGRLIQPLNFGKHAYVSDVNGTTQHVATDSPEFVDVVTRLIGVGQAGKLAAELDALSVDHPADGWNATKQRLVAAGIELA
jgi:hypothetical protein